MRLVLSGTTKIFNDYCRKNGFTSDTIKYISKEIETITDYDLDNVTIVLLPG